MVCIQNEQGVHRDLSLTRIHQKGRAENLGTPGPAHTTLFCHKYVVNMLSICNISIIKTYGAPYVNLIKQSCSGCETDCNQYILLYHSFSCHCINL